MTAKNHLLQYMHGENTQILVLNKPEKMNALATELLSDVAECLENADRDPNIRCSIITGNLKVFAAGADINELELNKGPDGLLDVRPGIWQRIRSVKKPIIAAVEGYCLGAGNELLMSADIAIAGRGAKFGQPETNLGIIPGAGGAAILPHLVGRQKAMRMVLLGEFISTEQAYAAGLVSEVLEKGAALERAKELSDKISKRSPLALMQAKTIINQSAMGSLTSVMELERQAFSLLLGTEDKAEGVSAFLKKKKPDWKNK